MTKVLATASELFQSLPFDSVTIKMISARSGVNQGLVHRYFGSKHQVLKDLMEHYAEVFRVDVQASEDLASAFRKLLDDPVQSSFARTLALVSAAGPSIDQLLSKSGAVAATLELARRTSSDKTDSYAKHVSNGVIASWSLILGWLVFQDFLIAATSEDVDRVAIEDVIHSAIKTLVAD